MARWAVLDVDGTLLPGASLERLFIRYCREKRILGMRHMLAAAARGLRAAAAGDFVAAVKGNKAYLRGCAVDAIAEAAAGFAAEVLTARLSAAGLERMDALRRDGHRIMLMTGAPEFLAQHLRQIRAIDHIIATRLATAGGRYTGAISGMHPYGAAKKAVLQQDSDKLAIDFGQSIAFADHGSDAEHLALFAQAVAVNPTPALRRIARDRGWAVEVWSLSRG